MRIIVIEPDQQGREALVVRLEEALRQARLKRIEVVATEDLQLLAMNIDLEDQTVCVLGPSLVPLSRGDA